MKRCCFLSMDDMAGYVSDDELAIEPLTSLGWHVETVSWRETGVDWGRFDLVVIRTTWDYQKYPDEFIATLERIDTATRLENSLDVVRWNLDKRYLRELDSRGVRIVPTIWDGVYDKSSFDQWLAELETDEVIIKPTVSATAQNTFRLTHFDEELTAIFEQRPFIVQPFLRTVIDEGEYSLFFFKSELSHTILKSPKLGDFRVQEEHGGLITETQPSEKLLDAARKVIRAIDQGLLYARVDLVRDHDDEFALMELELIEPALYLRMNADAPQRFAVAIDALFK
jgi:glutathione synthase/RimK-type ligase-like ATP-grasp enzyme